MKQRHIIFNVVGLTVALIFMVSGCGQMMQRHADGGLLWTVLIIGFVGGGSFVNLTSGGLSLWPTIVSIIGYFISFFLIPFGLWGVVLLVLEKDRRPRTRRHWR